MNSCSIAKSARENLRLYSCLQYGNNSQFIKLEISSGKYFASCFFACLENSLLCKCKNAIFKRSHFLSEIRFENTAQSMLKETTCLFAFMVSLRPDKYFAILESIYDSELHINR